MYICLVLLELVIDYYIESTAYLDVKLDGQRKTGVCQCRFRINKRLKKKNLVMYYEIYVLGNDYLRISASKSMFTFG